MNEKLDVASSEAPFFPPRVLVQALAPHVSRSLVTSPAWERIEAISARLPPIFAWGIFECRLAPDVDRVDVLFRVSRRAPGEAAHLALARALAADSHTFESLRPFLREWLVPSGALADVPLFWVEHDLLPAGPSAPFVQFCVDPGYLEGGEVALSPARLRSVAAAGVELLLGGPFAGPESAKIDASLELLARSAEQLPAGGRVLHVGVIPHRGTRDLRVLAAVPVAGTLAWLDAIGWPGDRDRAAEFLALLGAHFSHASVQLDLGETVRPTLAIEFPLVRPGRDPAWVAFVDALVRRGFASAEKAAAALAWIGDATHDLPGAPWLVNLERQLDIKMVLFADGRCEAKAYLCFHPRFVLL